MKEAIYKIIKDIHAESELKAESKLAYFGIQIGKVLEHMGHTSNTIPNGFYEALESLEDEGRIYDCGNSNLRFGRNRNLNGQVTYNVGEKIRLAH